MKYSIVVIILFFIVSCNFEKEETHQVHGYFNFTTASVNIDNINDNTTPPACINSSTDNNTITYTITSKGHYGSSNVVDNIRKSELRIEKVQLYFNDISINILTPSEPVKYNETVTYTETLTKDKLANANIKVGIYTLDIEVVASEYDGKGQYSVLNKTFGQTFGSVKITNDTNCK